jgi:hypothetical protein
MNARINVEVSRMKQLLIPVALGALAMPSTAFAQACPSTYPEMVEMLRQSTSSGTQYRDGVNSTFYVPSPSLVFLGAKPTAIQVADLYGNFSISISLPGMSIAPYQEAYKSVYPTYSTISTNNLMYQVPRKKNKLSDALLQSLSYQESATLLCFYSVK